MTVNYTSLLGLALPVTGTEAGAWGDVVNNYLTSYLDASVAGTQTITGSQTAVTLAVTNGATLVTVGSGATGSAQFQIITCTGNPASLLTITAPASSRQYIIINSTSTSQSVKIVGAGPTTGVTIVSGEKAHVAWNGSDFVKIATQSGNGSFVDLTVSGNLTLSGGTQNGVLYLNASRVATSGSALTFDGTNFANTLSANSSAGFRVTNSNAGSSTSANTAYSNGSEIHEFGILGTAYGGYGVLAAREAYIYASTTRNISLASDGGNIKFGAGAGAPERARIDTSGTLILRQSSNAANTSVSLNTTIQNALTLEADGDLLVGTTTNTNSSKLVASGTISETVSSTQYLVASQFDIGTAANEIPLNQYLGNLAYQDAGSIAGQVGLSAGTAALPSLVSATDTDTGMWFPAANTLAWSTGGTRAMTLHSSGGFSVGTATDPGIGNIGLTNGGKLQYSATAYISPEDNVAGARIVTPGVLNVATGGTAVRMTLDASGNLVAGTTAAAIGRATFVGGTQQLAFHDGNGSNTNFGLLNYGGTSGELTLNANSSGGNTLIRFLTSSSGANAERGRFSSDGTFRVKGAGTAGTTDAVQFSGSAPANSLILDSSGVLKENGYAVVSQADIGTAPNEVPLNQYLGTMAYQDGTNYFNTGMTVGFRNRIINGAMQIDQRNAGASVTPSVTSVNDYTLDRWAVRNSAASKFSVQQSTTAPSNFKNSLFVTSLAATSVGAGDFYQVLQSIEGLNCADLGWGSSTAKAVTLSFWVRSSLTGTFGGTILNSAENRSYVYGYTINAADTWEYKTVVIPGDTSGTWLTTTGVGIQVRFSLGMGSTYTTSALGWSAGTFGAPTGCVNVVATNGATWYVTGVQLEVGTQATPFDWRPYTTELQLCQRYFEKSIADGTAATATANPAPTLVAAAFSTTAARTQVFYKTPKRATPTLTTIPSSTVGTGNQWGWYNGAWNGGATTVAQQNANAFSIDIAGTYTQFYSYIIDGNWYASAEL